MLPPALIAVLILISGFIFGADFVGGLLVGTVLFDYAGLYTANAGGRG